MLHVRYELHYTQPYLLILHTLQIGTFFNTSKLLRTWTVLDFVALLTRTFHRGRGVGGPYDKVCGGVDSYYLVRRGTII